jgi:hypothetical protein
MLQVYRHTHYHGPTMSPAKQTDKPQHFRATLEKGDKALGWTIAQVPFDPAKVWKTMIRLRVQGTLEGQPFRTSLFPNPGGGGFYILVNRSLQSATGCLPGCVGEFTLAPDLAPREAELPDELAVLLDEEPGLTKWYESLTEYTRREIGKWIHGVKSDAARLRRAEQTAERLLATMEAEIELPPLIQQAFRARPKAAAGWKNMTETQRRNGLMAVFHYQTPEARQKRLARLCDDAEQRAG